MDDAQAQGSAASPSIEDAGSQGVSLSDSINAHLTGGQTTQATAQPETSAPTEAPPQTEGQPEEQQGRAEQRIQELIRQNSELQQKAQLAEHYQMFIASNPQARAAYEQAINAGATPEQAAQHATQQQGAQPPQQSERWYGDIPQDRTALPDWDPYDENVVREHAKVLIHDLAKDMLQPVLQQLQQVVPFVQQQRDQAVQTAVKQQLDTVQNGIYEELPSAKDNPAHFALAKAELLSFIQALPPDYQQAVYNFEYLPPQTQQAVSQVLSQGVKQASQRAKDLISQLGTQQPQQQQPAQGVQRPFAEGATNLVQPRGSEPSDLTGMIAAHINKSHS